LSVRKAITRGQYEKTIRPEAKRSSERFVSDERILDEYRWAQRLRKSIQKGEQRPDPATLAAVAIICEEFLGLCTSDAIQALLGAKYLEQVLDALIERKAAASKGEGLRRISPNCRSYCGSECPKHLPAIRKLFTKNRALAKVIHPNCFDCLLSQIGVGGAAAGDGLAGNTPQERA
jgi:hypothetical protein